MGFKIWLYRAESCKYLYPAVILYWCLSMYRRSHQVAIIYHLAKLLLDRPVRPVRLDRPVRNTSRSTSFKLLSFDIFFSWKYNMTIYIWWSWFSYPFSVIWTKWLDYQLQKKEPLQTQKHVALDRLLRFHHQTSLNNLNHH